MNNSKSRKWSGTPRNLRIEQPSVMTKIMKEFHTLFLIFFVGLGMVVGHFLISPQGKFGNDNQGIGGAIGFIMYNVIHLSVLVKNYIWSGRH
jgi:hypothetical protein